jgi:hypothetical protein
MAMQFDHEQNLEEWHDWPLCSPHKGLSRNMLLDFEFSSGPLIGKEA